MSTNRLPRPRAAAPRIAFVGRPGAEGVELRDLRPDDAAAVRAVFAGLGPRSRELRFLASKTRLTGADVRQLTAVDGRNHVGVVAVAPDGRPLGIARFIRDRVDPATAEVAVEVADEWQGRGVGGQLLAALRRRAVGVGVRRVRVFVSPENSAVLGMLARLPGAVTLVALDRWMSEYVVRLDG